MPCTGRLDLITTGGCRGGTRSRSVAGQYRTLYGHLSGWRRSALPVAVDLEQAFSDRAGGAGAGRLGYGHGGQRGLDGRAGQGGPSRGSAPPCRIRELVAEARREARRRPGCWRATGIPPPPRGTDELRAAVEALTSEGIVLRDLDAGLVDFPARLEDGREYLLCWVLGEPAVEWWHWPDTGFAGRRPLSDPPA